MDSDLPDKSPYTLEQCKLGELRGKGGIGSVYEALAPDGQPVAIKIMEQTPFIEPLLLQSITEGALQTQKVADRANVVKIYSTGKSGNKYYIIMDIYNCGTLEKVMDKSYPIEDKLKIAITIAETLAAIHSVGLIHGDLKPKNILLNEKLEPFLNDFYHSTIKNDVSGKNFAVPQGTPKYMSPEQASGQMITASSDIYSFGVLLYELLTETLPYKSQADSLSKMIGLIQEGVILPPSKVNRKIDSKLEAIIMKLLRKKPEDRYPDMKTAAADLKAYLEKEKISIPYKISLLERISGLFHRQKNT